METATATQKAQKSPSEMSLKELFNHVYGGKFPFNRKNFPMFERTDSYYEEREVNQDPDGRRKRPLMRPHHKLRNGRLIVPAIWNLEVDGEFVTVVSRKDRTKPAKIVNRTTGVEEYQHEFVSFQPRSANNGYRFGVPFFICDDEERYHALMLSPYCKNLSDVTGVKTDKETFALYDPNRKFQEKGERMRRKGAASAQLNSLHSENPQNMFAIAHYYGIPTFEGTFPFDEGTMLAVIGDLFTLDTHKPPHAINVDVFLRDSQDRKFAYHLLILMAMRGGVVREERGVWYYLVKNGGQITDKVQIGVYVPANHGKDRVRPVIDYLSDPMNASIYEAIQKDLGYKAGRPVAPLQSYMAKASENDGQKAKDAERMMILKEALTAHYSQTGNKAKINSFRNMGLKKLEEEARECMLDVAMLDEPEE